jgi:hypothetical protein
VLRRWLREAETLKDTEEVVYIYEPETGETISEEEMRSFDLIDFQDDNGEISSF